MNQTEKRLFLIRTLLDENPDYREIAIPQQTDDQRRLLHALFNVRPAAAVSPEFLSVQDDYLQTALAEKGITDAASLPPLRGRLSLWRGDITLLKIDAIVNAANSGMTGCYHPNHTCIDNCIHTFAGVQLRQECDRLMKQQGFPEPTGRAKITPGYNLPCRYVLHTVGPIVQGPLTARDRRLLADCYRSCLALAEENGARSVAFCCISTGVFGFPKRPAAEIAVATVEEYLRRSPIEQVVFNVFGAEDEAIYRELLQR